MSPARSLAAQTATRGELAVLTDGPWKLRWYWRSDLEAMQQASRNVGHPDGHPAAQMRRYQPTQRFQPHPVEPDVTGRQWRWTG